MVEATEKAFEEKEIAIAADTFATKGVQGSEPFIESVKSDAAQLLARINRIPVNNSDVTTYIAKAKEALEIAVMWATKAVSRTGTPLSV